MGSWIRVVDSMNILCYSERKRRDYGKINRRVCLCRRLRLLLAQG